MEKKDIASLVSLIEPFEKRAKERKAKRKNTLRGEDWRLCTELTQPDDQDTEFAAALKRHVLQELGVLRVLWTLEQCKEIVAYFKRSGLNSVLDCTLKQEVETRWNSKLNMLESFVKKETVFDQVRVLCG